MNLWYENLSLCLSACGGNTEQRARCIFAYLSMPDPRSWWEDALNTGTIDRSLALILHDLTIELSKVFRLKKQLNTGLLVAMAFIESNMRGDLYDCFDKINNLYNLDDYVNKAKKVLVERPELVLLAELIDNERRLDILEKIEPQRPNLISYQTRMIRGSRYNKVKKSIGERVGNQRSECGQNDHILTARTFGKKYGMWTRTIKREGLYDTKERSEYNNYYLSLFHRFFYSNNEGFYRREEDGKSN
jgi:hypothetical protein